MAKTLILVALILALGMTLQVKQQHTDFAKIEVGKLSAMQDDGDQWHYVALQNHFTNPVVLMQITSYNGGNPVHIRLQNIQNSSFEFKMEEWEYLDEWHTDEDINFLVAEKGVYTLSCGNQLQVGTVGDVMENFVMVHFQEAFGNVPVVHTQCQTHNGGHAVVTRTDNISNVAFEVKLKEQESYGAHPNAEVIGYVAIQAGNCGVIASDMTDNTYDHNWKGIDLSKSFKDEPVTFVSIQSHHGGNTAGIRMRNLATDYVEVMVEEEQSNDDEMNHLEEVLGWLAIEAPQVTKLELTKNCSSSDIIDECIGMWDCATIKLKAQEYMEVLDTNGDGMITLADDVDSEHLDEVIYYCDGLGLDNQGNQHDAEGVVTICELWECVMVAEQAWRDANLPPECPDVNSCYPNPFLPCQSCDNYWSCDDVAALTSAFMAAYDANGDGVINYGDSVENTALNQPNGNLKSSEWDEPIVVTFTSNCTDDVNIYWVDYDGDEQWYGTISTGESFSQNTYVTHPWRIYNSVNGDLLLEEVSGTYPLVDGSNLTVECHSLTAQYLTETDIMSTGWDVEIFVTFHNACQDAVDVYWVDYSGVNTFYATLYADQAYTQHTYETHPWRVYSQTTGALLFEEVAGQNGFVDGSTTEVTCNSTQLHDDHVSWLIAHCDNYEADGVIQECEIHQCIVEMENMWRADNCELFPELVCEPVPCGGVCYGSWDCPTIEMITEEIFAYYDTNGDYNMNAGDDIDSEHLTDILMYCDALDGNNDDGNLTKCELFTCIVEVENVWRGENCPEDFPQSYCPIDDIDCPTCPDAWTCDDIQMYCEETMAAMDSNQDGVINNAEYINDPHLSVVLDQCDMNADDSVCMYELFECVLKAENDWRYTYCPQYGEAFCANPYSQEGCLCEGMWTCDDIEEITHDIFDAYDVNDDGAINLGDGIDNDHLSELNALCDSNGNGQIEECEIQECLIAYENQWRAENCPDFGYLSGCPPIPCDYDDCEGAWWCADIEAIALEVFNYFNTDGSMSINEADLIEEETHAALLAECDYNNDGNVQLCELEMCIEVVENEWRAEYAPNCGLSDCGFGCEDEPECTYEWDCDDIAMITNDFFAYYDSNNDNQINAGDNIDVESFEIVGEYCDIDMSDSICRYEIFECLVAHEITWREENCPEGYMQIYCDNPEDPVCCDCEGHWTCDDVWAQANEIFTYYNTNTDDEYINMGDNITQEHMAIMNDYCDQDGDGQICENELAYCLMEAENEWRGEHCEDCFGLLYCNIPLDCGCGGSWTCDDIEDIVWAYLELYDSNTDSDLNPEDDMDPEHYMLLVDQCDSDFDGNVSSTELFYCFVAVENAWRQDNCDDSYGLLYCTWGNEPECIGAMNCLDVAEETATVMAAMDVNDDGVINLGDEINPDYAAAINEYCDLNNNDQLDECEVFECIELVENIWRAENCPANEPIFCNCNVIPEECPGAWHCEDIEMVTNDVVAYYDTDGDGMVTIEDQHDFDFQDFLSWCDLNGDCYVDKCELHTCVMAFENDWRDANCPNYGYVYCECPYTVVQCPEALDCAQIDEVTEATMAYYDYNMDNAINPIDLVDEQDLSYMVSVCDTDYDGSIDFCELRACILMQENEWLHENCPETPDLCCGECEEDVNTCGNFNCPGAFDITVAAWQGLEVNDSGAIDIGDIQAAEVVDLVDYCDENGSGAVDECELFQCVIKAENAWRNENCAPEDLEHLFCATPWYCEECDGAWTCEDVEYITDELFMMWNTNSTDQVINLDDAADQEHFEAMVYYCDFNNDGVLDKCEMFECVVMTENEWRAEYCPGYETLYCETPYEFEACPWCDGAWSCMDIDTIALETLSYYDTNGDGMYNPEDNVDEDHYNLMTEECDYNNDGSLSFCEIHECLIEIENEWRLSNCNASYGEVVCPEQECDTPCEGAWSCDDVAMNVLYVMDQLDSNQDGQINMGDAIESEHFDLLVANCDGLANGIQDESICTQEVYECIMIIENTWRDENCPDAEHLYCNQQYECLECPYHWTCSVIAEITIAELQWADTNEDGVINDADEITADHYEDLGLYCDYDGDDVITPCELWQCVVDYENTWRDANCPEYGYVYCPDCPVPEPVCEGAWSCEEIEEHTLCVIEYFDTNMDGAINPADDIDDEQYQNLLACDLDNNGSIEPCEMFECALETENAWRMENCSDYPLQYCEPCPWEWKDCDYEWNCYDIVYLTEDFFNYYNTNGDTTVNLEDQMDPEHFQCVVDYCDANGDMSLDACEIHDCLVMVENVWRLEYCEAGYEQLYCECYFYVPECEGHLICSDIHQMTETFWVSFNVDDDNYINLNDNIEQEHWDMMLDYCDQDGDEQIDICEVYDCINKCENEWRAEACPDYPQSYCVCDFVDIECPAAWNCVDIEYLTNEFFNYYNTNGDSAINPADNIDEDHYAVLTDYCDYNNDGSLMPCEIHDCLVWVENTWRQDGGCPHEYGYLSCTCDIPEPECIPAMNCDEIATETQYAMNTFDTNQDGALNLGDDVDPELYQLIMDNCDYNGDDTIHSCEIFECMVVCENIWRIENCPYDYPQLYCESPFPCPQCPGYWSCQNMVDITEEIFAIDDVNGDGLLNLEDMDQDHLDLYNEQCDINGNGELDRYEIYECLLVIENEWREINCDENFGIAVCPNPYLTCVDAWGCDQIWQETVMVMSYYDSSEDNMINPEDYIDQDHLDDLIMMCDQNFDGSVSFCELHDCVVIAENLYRNEHCPGYPEVSCDCDSGNDSYQYCEYEWNCLDIQMLTDDYWAWYNTNGDNTINYEDNQDQEHIELLQYYCDYDNDDTITYCEIHQCYVDVENEWRAQYCSDAEDVYCDPYFTTECIECPGAWNCEEIWDASVQAMWALDTNNDDNINLGDDITGEEYDLIMQNCDMNGDGNVTECEFFECAIMCENSWRDDNCPGYGYVYCTIEDYCMVEYCYGDREAWDCDMIVEIAYDLFEMVDTDGNMNINPEDDFSDYGDDFYYQVIDLCDFNNDGNLDDCEVFDCVVMIENEWRAEWCTADYGMAYCTCPWSYNYCEGEWNCDDIEVISANLFNEMDTDVNGQINTNDIIDTEHFEFLMSECDTDGNGGVDMCEMHDCVVMIENLWRDEYCEEGYPHVYCTCPFDVIDCPYEWTCEDILQIHTDYMAYYDSNEDGTLNYSDEAMDEYHLNWLNEYCDQNQDQMVNECEIFECIVMCENAYRTEYCPGYSMAYCETPFVCVTCEGAWNCDDIDMVMAETVAYYDTNGDNAINPEDYIDDEHYNMLLDGCDTNYDGSISSCEIHACIVQIENAWREENCPAEYGAIYCPGCVDSVCENAWNCLDIVVLVDSVMEWMDNNQDGYINQGDYIYKDDLEIMMVNCDMDENNSLDECEVHDCLVLVENHWRAEYCPDSEDLYCENPYECAACYGAWTCDDVYNITMEYMYYTDVNGDGLINYGDDMSQEHMEVLQASCDFDMDGSLDASEVHTCIIMAENEWRAENCPDYGDLICQPIGGEDCPGMWTCDDIEEIALAELAYYDTNGDMAINPEDSIDYDHYQNLQDQCDFNFDGTIDFCEMHECIVIVENEWRMNNCPDYGYAYCPCPDGYIEECYGAWSCADIIINTEDFLYNYDTNGDGQINMGDEVESAHLTVLLENCDTDMNGQVDACEVHQCMVDTENQWRADNCPEIEPIYCECTFYDAVCPAAWHCDDIEAISAEIIAYYDSNGDTAIDLQDEIDPDHYAEIDAYCNYDGNDFVDSCEVHACIVMIENEWRDYNCPDYGYAYCDCPFYVQECYGAYTCEEIDYAVADIISYYDDNMDGVINPEDYMEEEHYQLMVEYCDVNYDGTIEACEIHYCLMVAENEYRELNCVDYPLADCDCNWGTVPCDGAWNCLDIIAITEEVFVYYDTNGDDNINLGDEIEGDHLDILIEYCDYDQNGSLNACEIHDCVVVCENEWRHEYCPESEDLYCSCPYDVAYCPDAWTCYDVSAVVAEVMSFYDVNFNAALDLEDNMEPDHYLLIMETCDANGDEVLDYCETYDCIVFIENEWRAENCPEYGQLYCACPYTEEAQCEGAWDCEDIYYISSDILAYYDSNGDGSISLEDDIDPEHMAEINEYCDYNGDGVVDSCEVHQCIVDIENMWRAEYCPDFPEVYCDCPFTYDDVTECEGAWYCDDILAISVEIMEYYDTNNDGTISLEDDIDPEHLEEINMYCDYNENGVTDACEVHACIVMIENDWRDEYCPDYGHLYCDCPFVVSECEGAWDCEDIYNISVETLNYYDTNYDGSINLEDAIESEHYEILVEYCDYNNDGTIDACEVHQCIVDCENAWRDEYCPDYGYIYCDCPFYTATCDGAWNCDDIYYISVDIINYYDTNYDGTINLEDEIDPEHLAEINQYCDYNGDGQVDSCEVHQCIVDIENEWRDEYCPDSEYVYCDCPF